MFTKNKPSNLLWPISKQLAIRRCFLRANTATSIPNGTASGLERFTRLQRMNHCGIATRWHNGANAGEFISTDRYHHPTRDRFLLTSFTRYKTVLEADVKCHFRVAFLDAVFPNQGSGAWVTFRFELCQHLTSRKVVFKPRLIYDAELKKLKWELENAKFRSGSKTTFNWLGFCWLPLAVTIDFSTLLRRCWTSSVKGYLGSFTTLDPFFGPYLNKMLSAARALFEACCSVQRKVEHRSGISKAWYDTHCLTGALRHCHSEHGRQHHHTSLLRHRLRPRSDLAYPNWNGRRP